MNLFQKYGIKEVADVTFYSISNIGDETVYTPVLFLDTLKVSTIQKTAQKVSAEGGKGNKKLVSWNFGKDITLSLEDALFSPASMSLMMNGNLKGKLSPYMSAIVKANAANKYGLNNYAIKAYASPALGEDEWDIIFKAASDTHTAVAGKKGNATCWYVITPAAQQDEQLAAYINENRVLLKKAYTNRTWDNIAERAMPQEVLDKVLTYIDELNKFSTLQTDNHNIEVIDRFERCTVRDKNGLTISTNEQKKNLFRYYANDRTSSYVIYYDVKTMLPLLYIENGKIKGWQDTEEDTKFVLKPGTGYLKWSRTVKYISNDDEGSLGNTLVIDAETFSGDYKIVGETYIRNQKTGRDQRYQIVINRAQINSETNITLQADGDPTTFSMQIDVLSPQNGDLMELRQFNVDEDFVHGGTRVVAQNNQYTYTESSLANKPSNLTPVENGEIY